MCAVVAHRTPRRIVFDNGEVHKYKASSLYKISAASAPTREIDGDGDGVISKEEVMVAMARAPSSVRRGRRLSLDAEMITLPPNEGGEGEASSSSTRRGSAPAALRGSNKAVSFSGIVDAVSSTKGEGEAPEGGGGGGGVDDGGASATSREPPSLPESDSNMFKQMNELLDQRSTLGHEVVLRRSEGETLGMQFMSPPNATKRLVFVVAVCDDARARMHTHARHAEEHTHTSKSTYVAQQGCAHARTQTYTRPPPPPSPLTV